MPDNRASFRKAVAVLTPKQHIFLLSHMRSYTSLFGHIMGSNPHICGYYEMHIGYYSWKSLIRQKLLYFEQELPKPGFRYMFDKILHDEHGMSLDILMRKNVKPIFCLRHPQDVIPSILKLYQQVDPTHAFNSESCATAYYIQRLTTLEGLANALERDFFYLDAEAIKLDSQRCLDDLSDWLTLRIKLSPQYELQKNTSKARFGDSSGNLNVGRIAVGASTYTDFAHDTELQNNASSVYERVRKSLIAASTHHCITQPTSS
jgi:hypothetical protein